MAARYYLLDAPACMGVVVCACAASVHRQARAIGSDIGTVTSHCHGQRRECAAQCPDRPSIQRYQQRSAAPARSQHQLPIKR